MSDRAFDELAAGYDAVFTESAIGKALRGLARSRFEKAFQRSMRVLELGCGTGEDALGLACRGVEVVAVDASSQMIQVARQKAQAREGCPGAAPVEFHCLPMEHLAPTLDGQAFDGVLSNFGAVNCVSDLPALVADVASRLRPGAPLVWVVMGRYVPWEWLWYLVHGERAKAWRRVNPGGVRWRGLNILYPSPSQLSALLRPYFAIRRIAPLGVALPPTYAGAWLEKHPRLLKALTVLENMAQRCSALARVADHYIIEATRLSDTPAYPLQPPRFPFITRLVTKTLFLGYKLTGKHRYDDFRMERIDRLNIVVTPSVLNPKVTRTGAYFASLVDARLVSADAEVLDMGTGSGVCAIAAARHARRVVAVDINGAAVRCAQINALLNHLEHKIDVRHGDLFEPVAAERFDLILFNPPFLRGTPRDDRDRAWRSNDVVERFAANLSNHLKPGGSALVLLSTFGDPRSFLAEFRKQGFGISVFGTRRFINERLAIFKLTPASLRGRHE